MAEGNIVLYLYQHILNIILQNSFVKSKYCITFAYTIIQFTVRHIIQIFQHLTYYSQGYFSKVIFIITDHNVTLYIKPVELSHTSQNLYDKADCDI